MLSWPRRSPACAATWHGARRHTDEGHALTEQTGQATSARTCSRCGRSPTRSAGELDQGRERAERARRRGATTAVPRSISPALRSACSSSRPAGPPRWSGARAVGRLPPRRADRRAGRRARRARADRGADRAARAGRRAGAARLVRGNARRLERRRRWGPQPAATGSWPAPRRRRRGPCALRDAVELHDGVPIPVERPGPGSPTARLRRARRKAAARMELEAAAAGFDARGRACGRTAPERSSPASEGARPPRERSRRPSDGWPGWSPRGSRRSRWPPGCSSRRRRSRVTSRTSTPSWRPLAHRAGPPARARHPS